MKAPDVIRRLLCVIAEEADRNPEFARRIVSVLELAEAPIRSASDSSATPIRRGGRRTAAVLDPFALRGEGDGVLRDRLRQLSIDQLKDIVAEHGMDPSKLALKWRTADRLIDLIAATVAQRMEKGDAFRGP